MRLFACYLFPAYPQQKVIYMIGISLLFAMVSLANKPMQANVLHTVGLTKVL
jgi:hypothetical protein